VKQVMRYLATTKYQSLTYTGSGNVFDECELVGFSDSDWGSDYDTRRSTTGYVFTMAGGPVSWRSKRQPTVALSTCEAEYLASSDASRESVSWRMFLDEIGYDIAKPTVICSDNQSSIALTQRADHHARTKHIAIRYHYIRELVSGKIIQMKYLCTEELCADILTKALNTPRHSRLVHLMNMTTLMLTQ
jgi:hypothetical protein